MHEAGFTGGVILQVSTTWVAQCKACKKEVSIRNLGAFPFYPIKPLVTIDSLHREGDHNRLADTRCGFAVPVFFFASCSG